MRGAGLLQKVGMEGPDQVRMEATLASLQDPFEGRFAAQLQQRAAESWQRPGHPGWCIWGMDSEGFVTELKLQRGRVHIVVPVPPTSHSRSSLLPHGTHLLWLDSSYLLVQILYLSDARSGLIPKISLLQSQPLPCNMCTTVFAIYAHPCLALPQRC